MTICMYGKLVFFVVVQKCDKTQIKNYISELDSLMPYFNLFVKYLAEHTLNNINIPDWPFETKLF